MNFLRSSNRLLGYSITTPHKLAVINHLDELDTQSDVLGAVNSIVKTKGGKLIGSTFDGDGWVYWYTEYLKKSLRNKKIVILGAGGAARSLVYSIFQNAPDAHIVVYDIEEDIAKELIRSVKKWNSNVNIDISDKEALNKNIIDSDIVANFAGLGKKNPEDKPDIDYSLMRGKIAVDANYRPVAKNAFLRSAEESRAEIYNGLGFLIGTIPPFFKALTEKQLNYNELINFAKEELNLQEASEVLIAAPEYVIEHFESWWQQPWIWSSYSDLYAEDTFCNHWAKFFRSISPDARILDIGTGVFTLPRMAFFSGIESFNFVAIDPAEPYQLYPDLLNVKEFHKIKAEDMMFPENSFDAVISCFGIEYSNLEKTLEKVYAVLKPGGKVFFIMHHPNSQLTKRAQLSLNDEDDKAVQWIIDRAKQISADSEKVKELLVKPNYNFRVNIIEEFYCELGKYREKVLIGWHIELSKPNIPEAVLDGIGKTGVIERSL